MDLKAKVKNMPKVYFFNLDNRKDRKNWMVNQFDRYGIDYERISGTKYLASENSKWKNLILDIKDYHLMVPVAANAITHLDFLKKWYRESKDDYVLLMEDDYDIGLIQYWFFDWDDIMNRIPYDWDCILLGFENPEKIKFHLHPIEDAHDFGPVLLRREYVEKILDLHCNGDEYELVHKICNYPWHVNTKNSGSGTVDYFMVHNGRTYCMPLITINPNFGSFENNSTLQSFYRFGGDVNARNTCYFWWQNESINYDLDAFFSYGDSIHDRMSLKPEKFRSYDITQTSTDKYGDAYLEYFRN
jgi:hypothetical protein